MPEVVAAECLELAEHPLWVAISDSQFRHEGRACGLPDAPREPLRVEGTALDTGQDQGVWRGVDVEAQVTPEVTDQLREDRDTPVLAGVPAFERRAGLVARFWVDEAPAARRGSLFVEGQPPRGPLIDGSRVPELLLRARRGAGMGSCLPARPGCVGWFGCRI